MSNVVTSIDLVISLTPEEKTRIESAFRPVHIVKNDLWIREGSICHDVAFVESGKLRVYYVDDAGLETTCYFVTPGSFISSFTSFLTATPTAENIAAIEDCELMTISKYDLEVLSKEIPKLHIWRRVIAENLFISMEKRIAMLQSRSAYERYDRLIKEDPNIVLTVPLQYTASFLGITPQHLSRLRKEMQK